MKAIESAESLEELRFNELMPEPFHDDGFYFVYFADADYKLALKDILELHERGVRIWYDRRRESGQAWTRDMLARTRSIHCLSVIFYISPAAFQSDFFWQLAEYVRTHNLPYCPVMVPDGNGTVRDGYSLIRDAENFSGKQKRLVQYLFSRDITYIPGNAAIEEKCNALSKINVNHALLYEIVGEEATVIGVKDLSERRVAIPEQIQIAGSVYPVTGVASHSFYHCRALQEVKFPDTVTRVGCSYDAPATNSSLAGMLFGYISERFETGVDNYVFYDCPKLTRIVLPPKLKSVNHLFSKCKNLETLIIGPEVEDLFTEEGLGGDLQDELKNLNYLRLPPSVIYVEDTGRYFRKLRSGEWMPLNVPEGVEQVKGYTRYRIPEHLQVGRGENYDNLLIDSDVLESVTFDKAFCGDVGGWFSGCQNLTSAALSDDIGALCGTFQFCSSLSSVRLPKNLKTLDGTFRYCEALARIELPENLRELRDAFSECTGLEEITLPQSLEVIAGYCFENCKKLTEIHIPAGVSYISEFAFVGCDNMRSITVDSVQKGLLQGHASWRLALKNTGRRRLWASLVVRARLIYYKLFKPGVYKRNFSPFYLFMNAKAIYLKRKARLKGYKRVTSDRAGYYQYVPRKRFAPIELPER